jgi:Flp pilus assembly pilin Flp
MTRLIRRFHRSRTGAIAVEYAVMVMCIVIVIIASVSATGTQLNNLYAVVANYL